MILADLFLQFRFCFSVTKECRWYRSIYSVFWKSLHKIHEIFLKWCIWEMIKSENSECVFLKWNKIYFHVSFIICIQYMLKVWKNYFSKILCTFWEDNNLIFYIINKQYFAYKRYLRVGRIFCTFCHEVVIILSLKYR